MMHHWESWMKFFILLSIASVWFALMVHNVKWCTKYNLFRIPSDIRNFFIFLAYGGRRILKINGVWTVGRGWQNKQGQLIATYGPDKHQWILDNEGDWREIPKDWDNDTIQREVIYRNIKDLERSHPPKHRRIQSDNLTTIRSDWITSDEIDDYIRRYFPTNL